MNDAKMTDDSVLSQETEWLRPTTRFSARLRDWVNPAGVAGGAYLVAGAACPCCGGGACPVGLGGTVAVGGAAALVSRLWRLVRPGGGAKAPHPCHPSRRGRDAELSSAIVLAFGHGLNDLGRGREGAVGARERGRQGARKRWVGGGSVPTRTTKRFRR